MTWKTETKIADLDGAQQLEITCRTCRLTRYETPADLLEKQPDLRFATLDRVEAALRCAARGCRGYVRLAMLHDHLNEPFVGGLA